MHERDVVAVLLDLDPGRSNAAELGVRERAGRDGRLELTVDHAVRPVADGRELVRRGWG